MARTWFESLESRRLLSVASDLDPTFGVGGRVTADLLGSADDRARAGVAVQADGKLVVAGTTTPTNAYVPGTFGIAAFPDFAVARFNADGTLDPTFGDGGRVVVDFGPTADAFGRAGRRYDVAEDVAVAPDGTVVVVGRSSLGYDPDGRDADVAVLRLDRAGRPVAGGGKLLLDLGAAGRPTTEVARGVAVAPDGSAYLAATTGGATPLAFDPASPPPVPTTAPALLRLTPGGALDPAFGAAGVATVDLGPGDGRADDVAIDAAGRAVVAGGSRDAAGRWDTAVARFLPNGTPDPTFGGGDGATIDALAFRTSSTHTTGGDDRATSVALDAQGRIVVAGPTGRAGEGVVARYTAAGALDSTFGTAPPAPDLSPDRPAALPGGRLLNLYVSADLTVLAQPDGKLLVAGGDPDFPGFPGDRIYTYLDVRRLDASGSYDQSFNGYRPGTIGYGAALAPGGGVYVAAARNPVGSAYDTAGDFSLFRLTITGAIDPAFGSGSVGGLAGVAGTDFVTPAHNAAEAIALQPDGRTVSAGRTTDGLFSIGALVRHLPDGRIDPSFGAGTGRVVASGVPAGPDGSGGSSPPLAYHAVALQPDGKIVAVGDGESTSADFGDFDVVVDRYRPDGTPDPTFGEGGRVTFSFNPRRLSGGGVGSAGTDRANAVSVDAAGRIVVAGYAQHVASEHPQIAVARLTPGGQFDATFGAAGTGVVLTPGGVGPVDRRGTVGHAGATALALGPGGSILVAGGAVAVPGYDVPASAWGFYLAKYDAAGALDTAFGGGGGVAFTPLPEGRAQANAIALGADGTVVLAGTAEGPTVAGDGRTYTLPRIAVARYRADGTPDPTFGGGGVAIADLPSLIEEGRGVHVGADRSVTVAGLATGAGPAAPTRDAVLVRLTPAGSLDASFGAGGVARADFDLGDDAGSAVAVRPDGRVVVAGSATPAGGTTRFALAQFVGGAAVPGVASATFEVETRHAMVLRFDADVSPTFGAGDVSVVNVATGAALPASSYVVTATGPGAPTVGTVAFVAPPPDGNYRLTVAARGVADRATGARNPAAMSFDFFALAGDADRNRRVDLVDFRRVAGNLGRAGVGFSGGDFDYSGRVDRADLNRLVANFGRFLPAPAAAFAASDAGTRVVASIPTAGPGRAATVVPATGATRAAAAPSAAERSGLVASSSPIRAVVG